MYFWNFPLHSRKNKLTLCAASFFFYPEVRVMLGDTGNGKVPQQCLILKRNEVENVRV
jgi:hypothetical protein